MGPHASAPRAKARPRSAQAARASLAVTYRLQAKYPIEAQAPQSETYLYYDGAVRTATAGARLVVR